MLHTKPVTAGKYVMGKVSAGFTICLLVLTILNILFWVLCRIYTKDSGFEVRLWDFVATSGKKLMTDEAIEEIKKELLPLVTLITPNIDEAKVLTGKSIHNIQDMQTAAKMLTDDYQTNILLKGGHLEGDNMCDLLHTSEFIYHIYEEKKIESHNLHGTGCTLSSAIATYLAKGYPMRESIQHAKTYITQAIIAGKELNIGHGNGPLWHFPDTVAQMCTFCAVVS